MPRTRRKLGNVIVLPLAVSKSILLSQCHRPRMGVKVAPANGSSLRGAGHPLSVTDLRQSDCNDTGRSCVTTSCLRRMTVCGEDRTTSVLSCSTQLLMQISKAGRFTRLVFCYYVSFLWHLKFPILWSQKHMTKHKVGHRSESLSLGVWEPRRPCNISRDCS
jgi:hypothetical protein